MRRILASYTLLLLALPLKGQFLTYPDTINKQRLHTAIGLGAVTYGTALYLLNNTWYKDFPRESFHFFDDWHEWKGMDKAGHVYTTYFEAHMVQQMARWTGLDQRKSAWVGATTAILLQSTIEILDGFSSQWGFSWTDFGANIAGAGLFLSQDLLWNEQRIHAKFSTDFRQLNTTTASMSDAIQERRLEIFGETWPEQMLKDYNAQTVWLSFNIHSLLPKSKVPPWLNLAMGMSNVDVYGARSNRWMDRDQLYDFDHLSRRRQWILAPDFDLTRIPTRSNLLKALLFVANIYKIPSPALMYDRVGGIGWSWLYF